jgi:hypothetical protein
MDMGLFGGEDKKKRPQLVVPPGYLMYPYRDDPEESQGSSSPWQQTIQQARQVRSNFFNNMSHQSWNKGKSKLAEARMKRRRHL